MLIKNDIRFFLLISVFLLSLLSFPAFAQKTPAGNKKPKKTIVVLKKKSPAVVPGQTKDREQEKAIADSLDQLSDSVETLADGKTAIDPDSLISFAEKFLGIHYRSAGTNAKGFDCSGFTAYVFGHFGHKLPHTSAGQGLLGSVVKKSKAKKGDLIFFKGSNKNSKRIGHVGIVVSEHDGEVMFIHSAVSGGIRIDSSESAYYKARFVSVKRVIKKK
jgi:cell wall-associated NlpC family hydrolase